MKHIDDPQSISLRLAGDKGIPRTKVIGSPRTSLADDAFRLPGVFDNPIPVDASGVLFLISG